MKAINLRGEQPPDGDLVVIRSGVLEKRSDEQLYDAADQNWRLHGFWGLSVLVVSSGGLHQICTTDWRVADYGKVSLSTVGRIRRAGFPLLDTGDAPHFDIVLPDVRGETFHRLRRAFDAAQPNPPERLPE